MKNQFKVLNDYLIPPWAVFNIKTINSIMKFAWEWSARGTSPRFDTCPLWTGHPIRGLFTQITRHQRLTYLSSGDLICMRAKLQGRRPVLKHRQLVQRVDLSAISCAEVRKVRVAYHEKWNVHRSSEHVSSRKYTLGMPFTYVPTIHIFSFIFKNFFIHYFINNIYTITFLSVRFVHEKMTFELPFREYRWSRKSTARTCLGEDSYVKIIT